MAQWRISILPEKYLIFAGKPQLFGPSIKVHIYRHSLFCPYWSGTKYEYYFDFALIELAETANIGFKKQ